MGDFKDSALLALLLLAALASHANAQGINDITGEPCGLAGPLCTAIGGVNTVTGQNITGAIGGGLNDITDAIGSGLGGGFNDITGAIGSGLGGAASSLGSTFGSLFSSL